MACIIMAYIAMAYVYISVYMSRTVCTALCHKNDAVKAWSQVQTSARTPARPLARLSVRLYSYGPI